MDLSIIIVNFKSKTKLISCLNSIYQADLAGLSYEIIVVENNSGDDLTDLTVKYPDLKLIVSEQNLGMGGGNNLGIKNSSGRFILISNPDIVFEPDTIKKLLNYLAANSRAGLVAPKLVNPDGSLQLSCLRFPKLYIPILRRTAIGRFFKKQLDYYLMAEADHNLVQSVDWVLGACFIVRRADLAADNKLFDERYFMYFEDVDLCRRTKHRGQEVIYYPEVEVIHNHMRQSAARPWYQSLFRDRVAREHLKSAFKYFSKWKNIK